MKALLNLNAHDRTNALQSYGIMDTPPERDYEEIVRLAASICQTPVALFNLLDDHRQWSKSCLGIEGVGNIPIEQSFCVHALGQEEVMVVEDATEDARFRDNPFVTANPHIRFYAGAPLITPEGVPIGVICAIDYQPRTITKQQQAALCMLARQTMSLMSMRRRSSQERTGERLEYLKPPGAASARRSLRLLEQFIQLADDETDEKIMLDAALRAVCAETQWNIGHIWMPAIPSAAEKNDALELWYSRQANVSESYQTATNGNPTAHQLGLLGRSMNELSVVTVPSLRQDALLPYGQMLAQHGLQAGLAIPIVGKKLWGAMEFYWTQAAPVDPGLVETLCHAGQMLGRALDRRQAHTELQLSEAYFRHLVEDALDLITVLDMQGTIQFESRSLTVQLGWEPEDMLGHSAFEFVHPDDCPAVAAAFAESIRTAGPTPLLSFRFRHRDGAYRTLEGRGNNLTADPAVRGIVFSSRDITEQKRLEDQFGQLAGGIAHDFNNLMTVIVGYSSVAQAHPQADDSLRDALGKMRDASERAAGLTERLLASTSRQILQPHVFDLDAMLVENEQSLHTILGEKIKLRIWLDSTGSHVHADAAQINIVLRNLAQNARDAMPNGGNVYLGTRSLDVANRKDAVFHGVPEGSYVLLTMRDTGGGMTPEVQTRIFEPYYTTKPLGKGTGLGLASCQGIIRQSGGKLGVRSEVGVGTTVSVYLPVATAKDTVSQVPARLEDKPVDAGPPTVLFAEDEEVLRELGVAVLESLGCRVLAAENGQAALSLLDAQPNAHLDLLLTDIMMPEMDGKKLAEEIRRRSADTPIIFCSGYAQDPSFHQGLPSGATFLAKPYTLVALEQKISQTLPAVSAK